MWTKARYSSAVSSWQWAHDSEHFSHVPAHCVLLDSVASHCETALLPQLQVPAHLHESPHLHLAEATSASHVPHVPLQVAHWPLVEAVPLQAGQTHPAATRPLHDTGEALDATAAASSV